MKLYFKIQNLHSSTFLKIQINWNYRYFRTQEFEELMFTRTGKLFK